MLISINKKCTVDQIAEKFNINIPISEWVQCVIPKRGRFESLKYDLVFYDDLECDNYNCYFYFNDRGYIIAVDSVAKSERYGDLVKVEHTSFKYVIDWIKTNF